MGFITLKTFDSYVDAHLLKTKLESEGIPAYLFDEHINALNPLYSIATGGIKLKINESDIDNAIQIIREIENTKYSNDDNEIINCPSCGSEELYNSFKSMKGIRGLFSALASFLFMIFPLYFRVVYRCKSCEHEFKPEKKHIVI
ncbi:putative signal transducing protein [Sphingobacterium pedocola]|uniref:DUF2007 domain-containing protein n=1 Tax=Sphingobacterium pedocola TaxID=2082722 RepID=A0ABR9T629_9SPHI|nr:DUF2007 domain-containing protein [Sphingobacterium pedocola]MBE8720782.1 DUF2007 domain-containing protein [Sphingobacterium pedocola]